MADYFHDPIYNLRKGCAEADPDLAPEQSASGVQRAAHSGNFTNADPRTMAGPAAEIDKRNGWVERGSPELGFVEEDPISLAADELARLFAWLLVGGEKRQGPAPVAARDMTGHQLDKALRRPTIIACRVLAMLLRVRPDLLNGMAAKDVAKKMRISRRMMAFYTMNFSEHFPVGSKSIRRQSKTLARQIRESRHEGSATKGTKGTKGAKGGKV